MKPKTAILVLLLLGSWSTHLTANPNTESQLYYHPDGKQLIVSSAEDYVPLAAFLQRIKHENDRFFYQPGLNISKPISFQGERYQDDAVNYALAEAGYSVKRLAAYTYYVYQGEPPAIIGHTQSLDYLGKPYMALPNYLADIIFMMTADRGYRMLWSTDLNREHYYFNHIVEFFGTDFKDDLLYLETVANQKWPEVNIEVREDLKLIMINPS
jgi:hypothetical protein